MKDLLQEKECSDCVFHVYTNDRHCIDDEGDQTNDEFTQIRAHKAILTAQSDYFKAFFRKNSFLEANECIVRVDPSFSVHHVESVLTFLYTNSTNPLLRMGLDDLLQLLQLADLWLLTNLKEKAEDALKSHIGMRNVIRLYVLAQTQRLRKACLDFMLRNIKKLANHPEMQTLMASDTDLSMPVLQAVADLVVLPSPNKRQRTSRHPVVAETPSSMS